MFVYFAFLVCFLLSCKKLNFASFNSENQLVAWFVAIISNRHYSGHVQYSASKVFPGSISHDHLMPQGNPLVIAKSSNQTSNLTLPVLVHSARFCSRSHEFPPASAAHCFFFPWQGALFPDLFKQCPPRSSKASCHT